MKTSLRERLDHTRHRGATHALRDDLSVWTDDPAQEEGLWLAPINDRRESSPDRVGLISGFTLSGYLRLVDAAARLQRHGKASLPADAASIFARLGLNADAWRDDFERLQGRSRSTPRLGRSPARPAPVRRFVPLRTSSPPQPEIRITAR